MDGRGECLDWNLRLKRIGIGWLVECEVVYKYGVVVSVGVFRFSFASAQFID